MDEKKTFFPRKQGLAPDADGQERQRMMGLASHYFSDCPFTPTISMDINYIKPVFAGDVLEVTAQVVHSGRRVCFVKAEGRRRSDGKTAVTAQGSYMVSE